MEEDESIAIYNNKLKDMANESFLLGEPMSNERLIRKVLKTLPKKFAPKVTAIEEAQDLTTMSLDELIGNLDTFEMSLTEGESSKKKGITLKASSEDADDEELGKNINFLLRTSIKLSNGIQRRECDGFGHIQAKCPNYIKKQSKNYSSTLSDDESEHGQDEQIRNFVAFSRMIEPTVNDVVNEISEDEGDMTDEEVLENYKLLFAKWMELTVVYTKVDTERNKLKIGNENLRKLVVEQDQEIQHLKAQFNGLNKGLKMMNSTTNILEEILRVGKDAGDSTGIGFNKGNLFKPKEDTKFVQEGWVQQSKTVRAAGGHRQRKNRVWELRTALSARKGEDAELWHKRELVEDKVIFLEYVSIDKQSAYIFTKSLEVAKFESLRSSLGLCVIDK
ncbi:hypothetical protein LIER_09081 [Lithospermum erythrorhizon]|uniref:Gag-pol polyprotein n=1 Tax=Lithospermum erythrorhizon TaxID=34254 RepID=A0AAV3PJ59_LITER